MKNFVDVSVVYRYQASGFQSTILNERVEDTNGSRPGTRKKLLQPVFERCFLHMPYSMDTN